MTNTRIADFSLPATGDEDFRLSAHRGSYVVLYFYPKDSTPGCTTEAMEFRDLHPDFIKRSVVVAGISRDSLKSHDNFRRKLELPAPVEVDRIEAESRHGVLTVTLPKKAEVLPRKIAVKTRP